jgi:hypothetical protein
MFKKALTISITSALLFAASAFATNMPVIVSNWETAGPVVNSANKAKIASGVVLACLQTAANTRETAISKATQTYATAVVAAFSKRASDVSAAYSTGKTMKEIRPLIKTAFETFKTSIKNARTTFKAARKAAWDTHKIAVKACKPDSATEKSLTEDNTLNASSEWAGF